MEAATPIPTLAPVTNPEGTEVGKFDDDVGSTTRVADAWDVEFDDFVGNAALVADACDADVDERPSCDELEAPYDDNVSHDYTNDHGIISQVLRSLGSPLSLSHHPQQ
jgi:hypothetical protein